MRPNSRYSKKNSIEQNELADLSRTVREVCYLLLILVILYIVVPGTTLDDRPLVILGTATCGLILIFLQYAFVRLNNYSKIASEAIIMTLFITFILWYSGKSQSPLIVLYLIVVVYSALTIGQTTTLLLVAFITSCLLYFDFHQFGIALFDIKNANLLVGQLVTIYVLLLVAYMTIMVANHMHRTRYKIKLLSEHDELTGLLNMRAFSNHLNRNHKHSERYSHKFAIMMLDVDNLKFVNDQFGHLAGDRLITFVSEVLRKNLRSNDIAARYGGDEFIVYLPETSAEGAYICAERIKKHFEVTALAIEDEQQVYTSISMGISVFPDDGSDPETLVSKADQALYNSKRNGKNQITISSQMTQIVPPSDQIIL